MTKEHIIDQLNKYVLKVGSKNKAAGKLGVSVATISNMLSGKHDNMTDDLFRKVGKQLELYYTGWQTGNTYNRTAMLQIFADAERHARVYAICAPAGSGKDHTCKEYAQRPNVYMVDCGEYMNKKRFLLELTKAMGINAGGYNVYDMIDAIVEHCLKTENPLIILNEADKLLEPVLLFIITFYNKLYGKCGIVTTSTDYFKDRIIKGAGKNKRGHRELLSRFGKKFIELPSATKKDVASICKANGVDDEITIQEIFNKSQGDLRVVETCIHMEKQEQDGI